MLVPPDFKEFLSLLNSKKIEYLVIGGYAVIYHGYPRPTGDMDVWIAIDPINADSVVEALIEFGASDPRLNRGWFLEPGKVTRMGVPPVRLEILTAISGVEFSECFANRIVADF